MKKEIRWALKDGREARVAIDLVLEREIDLDGHRDAIPCCEISVVATVDGAGCVGVGEPTMYSGPVAGVVATIGKLALTQDHYDAYLAARTEIEAAPEWQANVAAEEPDGVPAKADGRCPHCGGYCYGDCQAND